MSELICARCGKTFEADIDHVEINAETKRINDRNEAEVFVMHAECWMRHTEEWSGPV